MSIILAQTHNNHIYAPINSQQCIHQSGLEIELRYSAVRSVLWSGDRANGVNPMLLISHTGKATAMCELAESGAPGRSD